MGPNKVPIVTENTDWTDFHYFDPVACLWDRFSYFEPVAYGTNFSILTPLAPLPAYRTDFKILTTLAPLPAYRTD